MTSTIVFDFDGTVAVGNGPVLAYARQAASLAGEGFLARVEQTIRSFDEGSEERFRDGYDVVGTLGLETGMDAADLQEAYMASRGVLGSDEAPVDAAPGLAELLDALPEETHVVLATNAPGLGVERVLASWGLTARFDELRFAVGKPAGLAPVIREALERGPVLSVGDIVENDLAPATALGADTALVGATAGSSPASVTMRAATLAELAPAIVDWARQASARTPDSADTAAATPTR